jgi:K+-sensing histidine kinase KdpD
MPDNLDALRQLGLRFIAGDTEQELMETFRRHEVAGNGGGTGRLMVAVTPLPGHDDLAALRGPAVDLDATWIEMEDYDTAEALIRLARQRRITHIVLGSGRPGRWHGTGSPVLRRVMRLAPPAGIDVHVMAMTGACGAGPSKSDPDIT